MVQMIDGMDNQAPGLNFSVGNIVGISELDLENMELLPGAASALYGPNAINGILLMNSKSPFDYQGASAYVRTGLMNEAGRRARNTGEELGATGMIDVAARYAKAFNNKFAFKFNVGYLQANDWQANDLRDPGIGGASLLQLTGQTPQAIFQSIIPGREVSDITRTGYLERDLADYTTKSLKLNGSLHYRLSDNVEAIIQGNFGFGTSVYTGAGDRYSLSNFRLSQIKAEVRGSNFYVRAYTTQERSGESYAIGILGSGINEAWKPSPTWYPQYFGNFAQGALTTFATTFAGALGQGLAQPAALEAARRAAQAQWGGRGRVLPGPHQPVPRRVHVQFQEDH